MRKKVNLLLNYLGYCKIKTLAPQLKPVQLLVNIFPPLEPVLFKHYLAEGNSHVKKVLFFREFQIPVY